MSLKSNSSLFRLCEERYYSYFMEPFINNLTKVIQDYRKKEKHLKMLYISFKSIHGKSLEMLYLKIQACITRINYLIKTKNISYLKRKLFEGTKCCLSFYQYHIC